MSFQLSTGNVFVKFFCTVEKAGNKLGSVDRGTSCFLKKERHGKHRNNVILLLKEATINLLEGMSADKSFL